MKKEWIEPVARYLHSNNPEASCSYDELPKGSDGMNGKQKQALRLLQVVERSGLESLIRADERRKIIEEWERANLNLSYCTRFGIPKA